MWTVMPSPIGDLRVVERDGSIVAIEFWPFRPPADGQCGLAVGLGHDAGVGAGFRNAASAAAGQRGGRRQDRGQHG